MGANVIQSVHRVFNSERCRTWLLALRKPLGLAVAAGVVGLARSEWLPGGLSVSAAGALLQWWCFGCIRTRQELAVNGPYKFVRNPMYLSRYLLVLGALMCTGRIWLLAVFTVLYYFYMVNRVRREEATLKRVFGAEYEAYCREVRPFMFSKGYAGGRLLYFDGAAFRRNHGLSNMAGVLLFYIVCIVVAHAG